MKRWFRGKGYGFIESDDVEGDIFVNGSDVLDSKRLSEGQKVRFDVEWTYEGLKAVYVRPT